MDESADIAGLTVLIVFVHYVSYKVIGHNSTPWNEIFNLLDELLSLSEIPWEDCADICTDNVKATMGLQYWSCSQNPKDKAKYCISSHCIFRGHVLNSRKSLFNL